MVQWSCIFFYLWVCFWLALFSGQSTNISLDISLEGVLQAKHWWHVVINTTARIVGFPIPAKSGKILAVPLFLLQETLEWVSFTGKTTWTAISIQLEFQTHGNCTDQNISNWKPVECFLWISHWFSNWKTVYQDFPVGNQLKIFLWFPWVFPTWKPNVVGNESRKNDLWHGSKSSFFRKCNRPVILTLGKIAKSSMLTFVYFISICMAWEISFTFL